MCKLFYLATPDAMLMDAFDLAACDAVFTGERDAAPGDAVPVVLNQSPSQLTTARWGLVPPWSRSPAFGRQLVNARSDSLLQRPAYRSAFRSRRCVILVDGFYERQRDPDGTRCLVRFSLASGGPMALAGLWEVWCPPTGDALRTCTMITVPSNELVGRVHGRMPAVLTGDSIQEWLQGSDLDAVQALLRPCPDSLLVCRRISL